MAALLISVLPVRIPAQQNKIFPDGLLVQPEQAEGLPIRTVTIVLEKEGKKYLADSIEISAFYEAFGLKPGGIFRMSIADMALKKIEKQKDIKSARYEVYSSEIGGSVYLVYYAVFLKPDEPKVIDGKKGIIPSESLRDFPLIIETENSKLTFLLNGGSGAFNENNAFFSKGPEFTRGNPIANDPAVRGVRFWGEAYLEPGIAGIIRIGQSNVYGYGAASVLFSGRNSSDIYSKSSAFFTDMERLYAGVLFAGIGKNKELNIDISAGRQSFQLNDGFLISKYSGSANAGERGSVYLNSRTAFEMTGVLKSQYKKFSLNGFYLEPQELSPETATNTAYAGASIMYNNNTNIDAGISYIDVVKGTAKYRTNSGSIPKLGMFVINPKLWLSNIGGTGLFLKSEYAYQSHTSQDMRSNAWYAGAGYKFDKLALRPTIYYRYAFMKGDDTTTATYERFDPVLTGGLGNWVQGIDFRKIVGNGNIVSHRVELKTYIGNAFELSADYFFLMANTLSNAGGLAPIAQLKDKMLGHEVSFTGRYYINSHFMLLSVVSFAEPGKAIREAFSDPVYNWASAQAALFMFF